MDATSREMDLPADFVSFDELKEDYPTLTSSDWKKLASALSIPVQHHRIFVSGLRGRRTVYGINWSDVERIEREYAIPEADDQIVSAYSLAKQFKMRKSSLLDIADKHSIPYWVYVFPNKSKGEGFKKDDAELLSRIVLENHGSDIESRVQNGTVELAPKNVKSVKFHARSRKMTERILLELCEGAGVVPKRYRVRGVPTLCLSDDQIHQLEKAYSTEKMAEVVPVSIRKYAKQNRIKTSQAAELARSAGLELQTYYFGSRKNLGLTPDEIETIEQTYKEFPRAPFASVNEKPLGAIAKEQGIDLRTMRKLLAGTEIKVGVYRFPNGKDLPGLSRSQVVELKQSYAPFIGSR